jgi:hypothetical protein
MKEVIKISFGSAAENTDYDYVINGETVHVRQLGAEYNIDLALGLVKKFRHECDAFAISGFPQEIKLNREVFVHKFVREIRKAAGGVPVHDGTLLRKAAMPWAL